MGQTELVETTRIQYTNNRRLEDFSPDGQTAEWDQYIGYHFNASTASFVADPEAQCFLEVYVSDSNPNVRATQRFFNI